MQMTTFSVLICTRTDVLIKAHIYILYHERKWEQYKMHVSCYTVNVLDRLRRI